MGKIFSLRDSAGEADGEAPSSPAGG